MRAFARVRWASLITVIAIGIALASSSVQTSARQTAATPAPAARGVFDQYCVTCHNEKLHTAGLTLDKLDVAHPSANAEVWERVIAKLRAGSMPPPGNPR